MQPCANHPASQCLAISTSHYQGMWLWPKVVSMHLLQGAGESYWTIMYDSWSPVRYFNKELLSIKQECYFLAAVFSTVPNTSQL